MAKKPKMFVAFVLDETGSMGLVRDDTIGGYNTYLDGLAKTKDARIRFTMAKFNSHRYKLVHDAAKLKDVPHLTHGTYTPTASTPLYDAIGRSITAMSDAVKDETDPKVCVAILTDGQENASHEYTFEAVSKLIEDKTAAGWTFLFLGAELGAVEMAHAMGIPDGNTRVYNTAETQVAFAAMSQTTSGWAGRGGVATATAMDDAGVGDISGDDDEKPSVVPPPSTNRAAFFQQKQA